MLIKNYEITNYRSCIKTKFDLPTNLVALIGANGVGKSNILYGLQLFSKLEKSRVYYIHEGTNQLLSTIINLVVEFQDQTVYIKAKIFYETDENNYDEVHYIEAKYKIEGEKLWSSIDSDMFEYVAYVRNAIHRRSGHPKQFQSPKAEFQISLIEALSNISYYSATQFSDPSKCPVSIELDDYSLNRRRLNRNHQRFIYDLFNSQSTNENTYNLFFNTVGPKGLNLIENIFFHNHKIPSSSYKVRAGGEITKIENSKRIIIPSITIDGLKLSPNQLSEGTFKTLALIYYILSDKSNLLLIEEPEVCVHHGLLESIIQLIKQQSRTKQIIISTHSDYILDMLEPENVILVTKEGQTGTSAKTLTKSLSSNDYKVLKEYLRTSGNLGEYWKESGFQDE